MNSSTILSQLFVIFAGSLSAFLITLFFSPLFIKFLRNFSLCKNIRENDSTGAAAKLFRALHLKKQGTPTMGGIMIWGVVLLIVIVTRLLAFFGFYLEESLLDRSEVYLPLFTLVSMGFLGAIDDYLNIIESKHKGMAVHPKMFFILLFSTLGALWFYFKLGYTDIYIPGIGDYYLGIWYIPLFIFLITGTSHAVNITDGLDGLAGGLLVISFMVFGSIAFFKGLFTLTVFCAVIVGSITAFLWHNVPPAKFYMGDTGSLALGACLGVIAMMIDSVFALPIVGAIFLFETLSVIIQVISKKLRNGKKVFRIAPVHHHFEAIGWTESQIVMRFWIIGAFFGLIGLIVGVMNI